MKCLVIALLSALLVLVARQSVLAEDGGEASPMGLAVSISPTQRLFATGDVIAKVPDLGAAETRAAIEAAHRAFPGWSKLLAKDRSKILRRWYDLIIAHADELALLLTKEQGKPLAEAKGEIIYGANFVEFFAEQAKRVKAKITDAENRPTLRRDPLTGEYRL